MHSDTVCILGGTGFVGRHIANRLANTDVRIKVLTGHPERNRHLLPIPNLRLIGANVHDESSLRRELADVDTVINLVGVLNDSKKPGAGFEAAHVELPDKLVSACRASGVQRLLHMSALGASPEAPSRYQQTKGRGEQRVMAAHGDELAVTAFRPSVVFGAEDSFLNTFARMLRLAPVLMLPTPEARFQPVYVGDVADAFIHAMDRRATFGQRYDLCGPDVYTLRELVEYCARVMGLRRRVIGLPDGLSRLQGRVMQHLPGKLYTYDNYLSSTVDNVCSGADLAELGIHPAGLDAVVPYYLGGQRQRQRYNQYRRLARR
jgi:NADH dehydrogenase